MGSLLVIYRLINCQQVYSQLSDHTGFQQAQGHLDNDPGFHTGVSHKVSVRPSIVRLVTLKGFGALRGICLILCVLACAISDARGL